jgi:6-phosphogluconolactonase/glucosamine-6-phosphate isomerase/deaminase
MQVQLNHVIVNNGGERYDDISYDDSAFEYAADTIVQHLDDDHFDNAKFVRLEAKNGDPKTAVERLISETGDGRICSHHYVTVKHPTINIPDQEISS